MILSEHTCGKGGRDINKINVNILKNSKVDDHYKYSASRSVDESEDVIFTFTKLLPIACLRGRASSPSQQSVGERL